MSSSETTKSFISEAKSIRENQKILDSALVNLEQNFSKLFGTKDTQGAVTKTFAALERRLESVESTQYASSEVFDALIELIGKDQVTSLVTKNRNAKVAAEDVELNNSITKLLENNTLKKAETVSSGSLLVLSEKNPKSIYNIPLALIAVAQFDDATKEVVSGKGVGFSFERDGSTVTIENVLEQVVKGE